MDSDLSGGWRYPPFEQLEPDVYWSFCLHCQGQQNTCANFRCSAKLKEQNGVTGNAEQLSTRTLLQKVNLIQGSYCTVWPVGLD